MPVTILVCGSRTWTDERVIREALDARMPYDALADDQLPTVMHGNARGADRIAADVAVDLGFWVQAFPADWKRHGKAAGPIRNRQMLDAEPDVVLAFQVRNSRGTQDTVDEALRRGIPVYVFRPSDE